MTGHTKRNGAHHLETTQGEVECDGRRQRGRRLGGPNRELIGHPAGIKPQVHEVIQIKLPRDLGYVVPMTNLYMPGQAGEGIYFRQDGPDSMIAGLHSYEAVEGLDVADPDAYSPPDSDSYLEKVAILLSERLQVEGLGFKYGWHGLYPISADGQFQVGPYAADPSVAAVAGLGGVGVASGATLGRTRGGVDYARQADDPVRVQRASAPARQARPRGLAAACEAFRDLDQPVLGQIRAQRIKQRPDRPDYLPVAVETIGHALFEGREDDPVPRPFRAGRGAP